MPGLPAAAIEYGQIRRIQKQQMERLTADPAEEKAAEAYTVQAGLRLPGAAFVQLHAVGKAVVPLGELPQGLPAAAAGIKEVGGNTLRELNTPEQQCDIVRVGGVIPQLDIVHKPSDHGGIGGTADWKRTSKAAECVIDRLISR